MAIAPAEEIPIHEPAIDDLLATARSKDATRIRAVIEGRRSLSCTGN